MIRPFTVRFKKPLFETKSLKVTMRKRLQNRLWQILCSFNEQVIVEDTSGWRDTSYTLEEVFHAVRLAYGVTQLTIPSDQGKRAVDDLGEFVLGAYPSQVLDVIEIAYDQMSPDQRIKFQHTINEAFAIEDSPWLLNDGQFIQIDADFLSLLASETQDIMKSHGFEGAYEEFREARSDLTAPDTKGAITNACKSMESVLKTILKAMGRSGIDNLNADRLLAELEKTSFFDDVPEDKRTGMRAQVLMTLPFLRNKLGGHGQGAQSVEIPKSYAVLAVNLAASFNYFLITKHIATLPPPPAPAKAEKVEEDEDLPF